MHWLKSKRFWLTVAHFGIAGAGIAGAILVPAAAPLILSGQALVNGLLPSPLAKPRP